MHKRRWRLASMSCQPADRSARLKILQEQPDSAVELASTGSPNVDRHVRVPMSLFEFTFCLSSVILGSGLMARRVGSRRERRRTGSVRGVRLRCCRWTDPPPWTGWQDVRLAL